jgi:2-polyprenyl-6-methoxyphenol hydroxylase-like FAD-dependent oxidoreductase
MSWDVAIIGGGPAGTASAISLRQTFPALRVLVIEATDYTSLRVGEVLPPVARALLQHLGVLPALTAEFGEPAHSVACAWGITFMLPGERAGIWSGIALMRCSPLGQSYPVWKLGAPLHYEQWPGSMTHGRCS